MAEGITMVEVSVEPAKEINKIIKGAYEAMKIGLTKAKSQQLHGFKVIGENRFLVVAQGDVEPALYEMNEKYGEHVRVTSTALRSYFSFAEKTLGVQKDLFPDEIKHLTKGGNMYYMKVDVTYKGITIEQLLDTWKREATAALSATKTQELSPYKAVQQNSVHVFLKGSPDEADGITFNLPMFREMGDQMSRSCKPIKHMDDY